MTDGTGAPTRLILGTAGHIDHGKTSLIRALTGVDTDRLQEEKERGITIDLGFAELPVGAFRYGVVDVPGHEAFVKNMLAGATGVDVVLLVVAADEGVMPQTREHLAIAQLLGVPRLMVALSKADLVEEEWLELAADDVREALADSPWPNAPVIPVSSETLSGLDALRTELEAAGAAAAADPARAARARDLLVLPVDRAFTVHGTGTVVTGTLRSGTLSRGDRVRLLPSGLEARVRGLQVHGDDLESAHPGSRTAVALTGDGVSVETAGRGECLVPAVGWAPSAMLTVWVEVLPESSWQLEQGQRVRLHLGTAEVLARAIILGRGGEEAPVLHPGEDGWVQLRLEEPVAARAGQRFVLRSYSPLTTFAGGAVAEVQPPKRRPSAALPEAQLAAVLDVDDHAALVGALELAGAAGLPHVELPVATGRSPDTVEAVLAALQEGDGGGAGLGDAGVPQDSWAPLRVGQSWISPSWRSRLEGEAVRLVEGIHAAQPFRPGAGLDEVRALAPRQAPKGTMDAVVESLCSRGVTEVTGAVLRITGFEPTLTPAQEGVRKGVLDAYRTAGLQPPATGELPEELTGDPAFPWILKAMEGEGVLVPLEADLYCYREALDEAAAGVVAELAGREGLGPSDFKPVLPVTRRYLLPILRYLDGQGVTVMTGDKRSVRHGAA